MTNIQELRELIAEATPGPWAIAEDMIVTIDPIRVDAESDSIADLRYFHIPEHRDNGVLIVAMRNSLPALLSELEWLRGREAAREPIEGSVQDRLEWMVGTVISGNIDGDARKEIASLVIEAIAEIARLRAGIAELVEAAEAYASQFGQALEANQIPHTTPQSNAHNRLFALMGKHCPVDRDALDEPRTTK